MIGWLVLGVIAVLFIKLLLADPQKFDEGRWSQRNQEQEP